jgi:hypothetical protein
VKKIIQITEEDIKKIVKLVLEQEDDEEYDEMEYYDAFFTGFRKYLQEKKNVDVSKYPLSYLISKYGKGFLKDLEIVDYDDDEDDDEDFQISRWRLPSYGKEIIKKGYVKIPSLKLQGTFKETFPKVLDNFIQRLNLPEFVKVEIVEPKPFVLEINAEVDFQKALKSPEYQYSSYAESVKKRLEKFLREYLGLQINSRYLGGVEISGANQNKLIDDIWFQNELKSIRKQLRQLGGATNIHSIRADFNDNSVKLRLTFKDTLGFGFAGKRKLRDDAQNLLRELGYDNRKVSIDY